MNCKYEAAMIPKAQTSLNFSFNTVTDVKA